MAKLKRVVDATEYAALPAAQREFYTQRGEKYVLDADDAEALQQSLETERQAKKALEQRLAGYGDLTPEQVKALNDGKAKAEREKDFAAGNFEKILAEEKAKHAKDLELRDAETQRIRGSLQSALIDSEAVRAITAMKGNADLLLPIVTARAKLQSMGDREVAVIIGEKGGPRLKAGAKGAEDFMGIPEYVAELRADPRYKGAFDANVGSGSGGRNGGSGFNKPLPASKQEKMNTVVQMLKEGATRIPSDV